MSDENVGGWKLVSVEPSQFQIQSIQAQTGCDEATARLFWSKLLYWASEPPADLSAHGQPVVAEAWLRAIDYEISVWAGRMSTKALIDKWPEARAVHSALRNVRTAALKGADHA